MELSVFNIKGEDTGRKVTLNDAIFGIEPNDHAIYLDVKQYLANQRQGTHKSKERSEVSGLSLIHILIVDSLNQLSSFYGQYSPSTKLAIFNDSVRLENEQFTLYSDTLHYNTDSKIATILGPSIIVSDSGTIYSSRGWYDTVNNTSLLLDRSQVVSGDRILTGDSIAYNRELGLSLIHIFIAAVNSNTSFTFYKKH